VPRPVTPDDWTLLREVRLRALADAPDAFGSTLDLARQHSDDEWRARARGSDRGSTLLALAGARPVGMGGVLLAPAGGTAWIWGMWTAPEARGRGLAAEILDQLVSWCRRTPPEGAACVDVRLHVTEGNDGARRLYEARGFEPTGTWEELRPGSPLRIEELRLRLT
jgi:GNAT superfamily N-acetyltransferase